MSERDMVESYKEIEVSCPICQIVRKIKIPEAIFNQKKFGTIKVQVPKGGICKEHHFIVFLDTKGIVRGYEKIDLSMITLKEEESSRLTLRNFVQMFGTYGLLSLMHAKIFNYPAYVIRDKIEDTNIELINKIAERLLPESYRGTSHINLLKKTTYDEISVKEKNSLIIDSHQHILQTPWEDKLKFEEELLNKALDIFDQEEQMIIVQQNIFEFIREAEYVKNLLDNTKKIYEEELIEKISRELMIPKPSYYRISLIKDFIKQRYSPELAQKITSKVEEFLTFL
ncbi:MAG: hypothetical protein ACFFBW_15835, partial [Promethearchaeota archaeon]